MIELARLDHCFWTHSAAAAPPTTMLEQAVETRVAIVGAGFSGLSTALHLAERGIPCVVLEAGEIGGGASGRNNGQVIPTLSRPDPSAMIARFGKERGERFVSLVRDSAQILFDIVRRYDIACDAEQNGWIQPSHSPGRHGHCRGRRRGTTTRPQHTRHQRAAPRRRRSHRASQPARSRPPPARPIMQALPPPARAPR